LCVLKLLREEVAKPIFDDSLYHIIIIMIEISLATFCRQDKNTVDDTVTPAENESAVRTTEPTNKYCEIVTITSQSF